MNKKELLDGIDKDLCVNSENLEVKIYEISGLHSKYLRLFFDSKTKLNKKKRDLDIFYKKLYYKIKEESNDLINQKEIIFNILGDEFYSKLNLEVQTLTDLVDILDRTIKKVNNMSFDIKNIISYQSYLTGVL